MTDKHKHQMDILRSKLSEKENKIREQTEKLQEYRNSRMEIPFAFDCETLFLFDLVLFPPRK